MMQAGLLDWHIRFGQLDAGGDPLPEGAMIGLIYLLRRLPNLSPEEFQRYWGRIHGPLVAGNATNLGLSRYIQSHAIQDPLNNVLQKARAAPPLYDSVDELWWNNRDDLVRSLATLDGERAFNDLLQVRDRLLGSKV